MYGFMGGWEEALRVMLCMSFRQTVGERVLAIYSSGLPG
jgi:hypothetical protein